MMPIFCSQWGGSLQLTVGCSGAVVAGTGVLRAWAASDSESEAAQSQKQKQQVQVISVSENSATSGGLSATCHSGPQEPLTQEGAAAAAHAQLQNIASQSVLHANASTTTPENISSDRDLKVASGECLFHLFTPFCNFCAKAVRTC